MDYLLAHGAGCVCVLDVSGSALRRARARLGDAADSATWIETDVTAEWATPTVDIWHDRAVFHFLTDLSEQDRYIVRLRSALRPRGFAIIATFALDGPEKCSGLPVARYSPESLAERLGADFMLVDARKHAHRTPWGGTQAFQYSRLLRAQRPPLVRSKAPPLVCPAVSVVA